MPSSSPMDNRQGNDENSFAKFTQKENVLHAFKKGLSTTKKGREHHYTRIVLNIETGIYYWGAKEASLYSRYSYGHLKNVLSGRDTNHSSFKYV